MTSLSQPHHPCRNAPGILVHLVDCMMNTAGDQEASERERKKDEGKG
jgi:hypothetical protein